MLNKVIKSVDSNELSELYRMNSVIVAVFAAGRFAKLTSERKSVAIVSILMRAR